MRKAIAGFALGLIGGVIGAVFGQPVLAPYLPAVFGSPSVETAVIRKRLEPDRLLLTVQSEDQAVLATFTQRLEEIDLLVSEGDVVILRLPPDEPFVKDPPIVQVKPRRAAGEPPPTVPPAPGEPPGEPAGEPAGEPQEEPQAPPPDGDGVIEPPPGGDGDAAAADAAGNGEPRGDGR